MKKVLILNRGEIACRLIQACQELDLSAVAVASEVDAHSPHVKRADETIFLKGNAPQETYLNLPLILEKAKALGCDAVHPGYGFVSERAHAAEAFLQVGIEWIGPRPASIRQLGDKLAAKKLLDSYSVPTAPWGEVKLDDMPGLKSLALKIGFPVLLKAASGGGGKGMRLVRAESELEEAAKAAAREAAASFGDATLLLEKFIDSPRHIEIQILGDTHGNIVHLGERECSLQRKHQKIVEEAPAPHLSQATRDKMGECAVRLAKGVGYCSAGTVEFLVDSEENFYFLEVNSRLQVEHSVTEAVWGVDLVRSQILIAQGKKLEEVLPSPLAPRGHAIQCRIYAENAALQFAPCPGLLALVEWPVAVGLRIDSGIKSGGTIGLDYDAMIAKITAYGSDRPFALQRMQWALKNTLLFGAITNVNFLQDLLSHPPVVQGKMNIKMVEKDFHSWRDPVPEELKELAKTFSSSGAPSSAARIPSPWEVR